MWQLLTGSLILFFYLMAGHALADFALQSDTMAKEKSWTSESPLQVAVPWYYWLAAHALIHGGVVALITGHPVLGFCETLAHWLVDTWKISGHTTIHQDQALHVLCKLSWIGWLVYMSWPG